MEQIDGRTLGPEANKRSYAAAKGRSKRFYCATLAENQRGQGWRRFRVDLNNLGGLRLYEVELGARDARGRQPLTVLREIVGLDADMS